MFFSKHLESYENVFHLGPSEQVFLGCELLMEGADPVNHEPNFEDHTCRDPSAPTEKTQLEESRETRQEADTSSSAPGHPNHSVKIGALCLASSQNVVL